MTRRSATFHEVSLCISNVDRKSSDAVSLTSNSGDACQRASKSLSFVRAATRMASSSKVHSNSTKSLSASAAAQDSDAESTAEKEPPNGRGDDKHLNVPDGKKTTLSNSQINLLSIGKPLSQLKRVISSATKLQKLKQPDKDGGSASPSGGSAKMIIEGTKKVDLQERIEYWTAQLRAAIHEDISGRSIDAFDAYRKFNRQVTKEIICDFQMFTCDQQKLLNRLLISLDRRCLALQSILKAQEKKSKLTSTSSSSSWERPEIETDSTLEDLNQCVGLLSTVRTIGSNKRLPVVLVYRERRHRIRHRHQEKGKSNKIVFPKEKRDFLQMLGLPGKMVTEQGIDFSIQPNTELEIRPRSASNFSEQSAQNNVSEYNASDKTNGVTEVFYAAETLPEEEFAGASSECPEIEETKRMSIVDRCIRFKKRLSVSPLRTVEDKNANQYRSRQSVSYDDFGNVLLSNKLSAEDTISTLSCDSCSSNESSGSDFEEESHTDTAVLCNYFHQPTLLPPPVVDNGGTFAILSIDKVGIRKTSLLSPFLRISLRDENGCLLSEEQETGTWEICSRNYLKAPSPVYIQEPLETLPDDMAIFFEIRHLMQERRKLSTHCYTFLEKSYLRNGEFVCEIYRPPVDFSRRNLIPYSEKALFLHLEVKLHPDPSDGSIASTICSLQT